MPKHVDSQGLKFWVCSICGKVLPWSCIIVNHVEYCPECWAEKEGRVNK